MATTPRGWRTCYGERCRVWSPDLRGPRSSAALFDPYSFAHMVGAGLQFFLIPPLWLAVDAARWQLFLVNLLVHAAFELCENAPCVIRLIRACPGGDESYAGDTVLNTVGDLVSFSVSYALSAALFEAAGAAAAACVPALALLAFLAFYASEGAPRGDEAAARA